MDSENQLFQQVVAFLSAAHQVEMEMTKDVKSDDITPLQYRILEYLAVSPPATLSRISDCQHMSMPNTSRELKKLTEKGLCVKITDSADRRKQLITLSPEGRAQMDDAFTVIEARFRQRIKHLSAPETADVAAALALLQSKVFYDQ
jgi:DNA-binding MarR family transcriptional regulator